MQKSFRMYLNAAGRAWSMRGENFQAFSTLAFLMVVGLSLTEMLVYPRYDRALTSMPATIATGQDIVTRNQVLYVQMCRTGDLDQVARYLRLIERSMSSDFLSVKHWNISSGSPWLHYEDALLRIQYLQGLKEISSSAWQSERLAMYQAVHQLPPPNDMVYQPLKDLQVPITMMFSLCVILFFSGLSLFGCMVYLHLKISRDMAHMNVTA